MLVSWYITSYLVVNGNYLIIDHDGKEMLHLHTRVYSQMVTS